MRVVSSKEFRDKQAMYFDQIDSGEEVLILRGKTKSYRIIPVTELDTMICKEYILEPDTDLERAIPFEEFEICVKQHIGVLFNQATK